jgi:hypothetical protein
MGFMTVIAIHNDQLDDIEKHPKEFVKNLLDSIPKQYKENIRGKYNTVAIKLPSFHNDFIHDIEAGKNDINFVKG